VAAALLAPFMPEKMQELWTALGAPTPLPTLDELANLSPAGWRVQAGGVLFPRPELVAARPA
jgi:methionyl-tRNA synthetase